MCLIDSVELKWQNEATLNAHKKFKDKHTKHTEKDKQFKRMGNFVKIYFASAIVAVSIHTVHIYIYICILGELHSIYPLCADKYQIAMRDLQRVRVQVRDQIINYVRRCSSMIVYACIAMRWILCFCS